MPIYAYECYTCGVRFDRRQSFSDEPIAVCPECGGQVHRLIQPAGIIFKGSGFYVNDSRGSTKNLTSSSKKDDSAPAKSKPDAAEPAAKPSSSSSSSDD
jgi:putative FmdB family regulatory protein